jgi:predicted GNAT family acetyltransferase
MNIADHPERHRYELDIDGRKAAEIIYRLDGSTIEFVHTEVQPEHEGQGLASRIAAFAFDDARKRGLKVIATCDYIQRYAQKHPDAGELLTSR